MINIYILNYALRDALKYVPLLSTYQQTKIKKAHNEDYITQQITSELLLLYVLHNEQVPTKAPLNIKTNKHGKPYINDTVYKYSVSHTQNIFALSFSQNETGIDIESITRNIAKQTPRFLSKQEHKAYLSAATPNRYALKVWTRKEALLKYVGVGLVNDLFTIDTTTIPVIFNNQNIYLENFAYHDYMLALATKEQTPYKIITIDAQDFTHFINSLI